MQSFDECSEVVSRQTQKSFTKREITLVDQTEKAVKATLWGGDAEKFHVSEDNPSPVMAIKVGGLRASQICASYCRHAGFYESLRSVYAYI